ncbi:exonuclease domain-containing protein [uncultured Corynebacterium sp.]|uniref:exonuclease domain-containing protein n=1 Tax=uncultured Corynebacterium sp. TaxID=159447 RepID=UPI0025D00093|nr:exonuclease domain-containing protein [uncultured Corynebacterium sp.]
MPAIDSAARADNQPVLDFRLSGAQVRVSPTSLTLRRIARTLATDSAEFTTSLDDGATVPRLTEPGTHLPGRLELGGLGGEAPEVRVTPSTLAAARALVDVLGASDAAARAEALATAADSGTPGITAVDDADGGATDGADAGAFAPSPASPAAAASESPATASHGAPGAPAAPPRESTLPTLPAQPDFYAFDVETANADEGSIIQFGIAAVHDGEFTESWSWPCRPPAGLEQFDEDNIAIHGIRPSDVATAPTFAERLDDFAALVDGTPVVAHNAKFDFTALQRACRAAGVDVPDVAFACTFRWAKRIGLKVENYRLPTLAAEAGADGFDHHDAAADAVACAKVALWLMKEHPGADVTFDPIRYSENLGMEAGMLFGSTLLQMRIVGDSAVDGGGAPKRRQARRAKWDAAKTPDVVPERNEDADPDGLLFGQNVTLTGDFAPYDKGRLWELIADAGATVGKNTTKKTTILVAGPWDSVTSKEKKAREYIEKGQNIEIWDEKQLFKALELTEEPPF